MKITDVEPIVLRVSEIDVTRADGTQDAFLVRIHTDEGLTGIGEADTSPYVARTMVEMPSSHAVARGLRELLVGEDPLEIGRLWQLMFHGSDHYGRGGAALHTISAIDMALWDLAGKAADMSIAALLGGRRTERVRVYASEVMPETTDSVRLIAEQAVERGYTALKLGWGPLGRDRALDVALIEAARASIGPDRDLMIDGGRAYTVQGAADLLHRVEDVGLYWLEEPLQPDDVDGYGRLSSRVAVRLAAGEADAGIRPFRTLVERGGVSVLQPDLGRCGGFTVAREIAYLARESGVEVVPHCFSSGVLVAASLQFVASLDRPTLSEFSVADSPIASGLLAEPFLLEEGYLAVPCGPGLGVELDEDLVAHLRIG
ncbi:MAG: mandelate racemase/muconate lactonizing enzyme family protein [Thermoleophilia bacterium]|nr:mandelate racemase/muconate lactonizing enzyme family protein [Thermoleophilia bacterium]